MDLGAWTKENGEAGQGDQPSSHVSLSPDFRGTMKATSHPIAMTSRHVRLCLTVSRPFLKPGLSVFCAATRTAANSAKGAAGCGDMQWGLGLRLLGLRLVARSTELEMAWHLQATADLIEGLSVMPVSALIWIWNVPPEIHVLLSEYDHTSHTLSLCQEQVPSSWCMQRPFRVWANGSKSFAGVSGKV